MASNENPAARHKPPISAHRAFPAIVALWFAALLGIGSFVLPASLLENLAAAAGMGSALDFNTRMMIALAGATLGALIGLVLARRLAASHQPDTTRAYLADAHHGDAGRAPIKPLSVQDEFGLGALGLDQADHGSRKRRSLAVTQESGRSEYLVTVPLPGAEDCGESVAPVAPDFVIREEHEQETTAGFIAALHAPRTAELPVDAVEPIVAAPLELALEAEVIPHELPPAASEPRTFDEPSAPLHIASDPVVTARLAAMSSGPDDSFDESDDLDVGGDDDDNNHHNQDERDFDPLAELRRALGEQSSAPARHSPAPVSLQHEDQSMNAMSSEFAVSKSTVSFAEPKAPLEQRDLADLSLVELVERFAGALQRRSAAQRPATRTLAVAEQAEELEALVAALDPAPAASAPSERMPAALRPFTLEDFEDHDDADFDALAPFSLKLDKQARMFEAPAFDSEAETADEEEDDASDQSYSSLLDLKRPYIAEREFVRIDEADPADGEESRQPVVVFPGQQTRRAAPSPDSIPHDDRAPTPQVGLRRFDAPFPDSAAPSASTDAYDVTAPTRAKAEETERALREALQKLQRMSGAA